MNLHRFTPLALALLLFPAACSDAPQKLTAEGLSDPQHAGSHDGHDHGSASWDGVIVLTGERAQAPVGVLMVSLVLRGQRMPRLVYRIDLADAPPAIDGERRVPFLLDETTDMLGEGLPPELADMPLEISVRFDLDGMVETSEGDITVAVPVGWGGHDIEVLVGG